MNRTRSLSSLLVVAVVAFAWSCGEEGWCSNGAFLNEESCVFAGHEWTPKPEPASCNAGNTVVEGQNPGDCLDGADNDMDGLFDCEDDTCAGSPDCEGVGDDDTAGGGDDDTSGGGDDDTSGGGDDDTFGGGDDDTSGGPGDDDSQGGGNSESGQDCQATSCPNCEDGVDNDGDGDIDCADEDCSQWCGSQDGGGNGGDDDDTAGGGNGGGTGSESGNDCTPTACPNCEDEIDNDGDGDIDCADKDCSDWCGQ